MIGERLEQRAVVRDEEDGGVEGAQISLEPQRGLEVEVVGRLVEEQQVGRRRELAGQGHAAALAAAQGGERLGARGVGVEAEAVQDGVHPRRGLVAALVLEAVQVAVVALQHRRRHRVARLAHRRGLHGERALEREQVGEGARGGLPHRRRVAEIPVLVHHRDAQAGRARDGAARGGQVAADQVEERRLAGAVASQNAPALAAVHEEAHVLEQLPVAEAHRDAGHREQVHRYQLPASASRSRSGVPHVLPRMGRDVGRLDPVAGRGQVQVPLDDRKRAGALGEVEDLRLHHVDAGEREVAHGPRALAHPARAARLAMLPAHQPMFVEQQPARGRPVLHRQRAEHPSAQTLPRAPDASPATPRAGCGTGRPPRGAGSGRRGGTSGPPPGSRRRCRTAHRARARPGSPLRAARALPGTSRSDRRGGWC